MGSDKRVLSSHMLSKNYLQKVTRAHNRHETCFIHGRIEFSKGGLNVSTRKIVRIDEERCDGCGVCIPACAEGALRIVDGKARLVADALCDGLGACLGECPQSAIIIEEREGADFEGSEPERVSPDMQRGRDLRPVAKSDHPLEQTSLPCGCPGAAVQGFGQRNASSSAAAGSPSSALSHWPVQLMLVPPTAPFLRGANILVCADCVPFAVPDFHSRYLHGRVVLVGCPKLDDLEHYRQKLRQILEVAQPASLTVVRMEVPCCAGIANAVIEARDAVMPDLPVVIDTVGIREGSKRAVSVCPEPARAS